VLINTNLSRAGLGRQGDDLRVQLFWIGLWCLTAVIVYGIGV
jgi:hypothetical protein